MVLKLPQRVKYAALSIASLCLFTGTNSASESITPAASHDHPAPVVLAPGYAALEFTPPKAGSYALPPMGNAGNGAVLDTQGNAHMLHDYFGEKITVLSFIYTTCTDVNGCPLATFVFKSVQNTVLEDPAIRDHVRLLSFSFDPQQDSPEVLGAYAQHFKKPGFDWQFLTTHSIVELDPILAAYGQSVIRDYDSEGNFLGSMSHILRVFLIDTNNRIRNIYSTSYLHADTVANDIRTLLYESH